MTTKELGWGAVIFGVLGFALSAMARDWVTTFIAAAMLLIFGWAHWTTRRPRH